MVDLLRYTASRCAGSQTWVSPGVAFVLLIAVCYPSGAGALGSMSIGIVILLVASTWIGSATITSEPASQERSLAALQGGMIRYRLALLLTAAAACALLIPLSIGWALVNDPSAPGAAALGAAVLAHLTVVLTGTAVAAVTTRPLVNRRGRAFLLRALVLVVLVATPGAPPVRTMITALDAPRPDLPAVCWTTAGSVVATGLVWWGSAVLASRRA